MEIRAYNAPTAYEEVLWRMRRSGEKRDSRNGQVIRLTEPLLLAIDYPTERLITDPIRDANPFFHCMEFIWMMTGSDQAEWITQFNSRIVDYAEPHGVFWGAYGNRWRTNFEVDQISEAVEMLRANPDDRRVVLGMWDPRWDLNEPTRKDLPCNTHIYLEVQERRLNMLVCNRSNDVVWGMMGANVVHMTMLQELIALAAGYEVGRYFVVSNNAHIYTGMPRFKEIWDSLPNEDIYKRREVDTFPLLKGEETLEQFFDDCEVLVNGGDKEHTFVTSWMINVGYPIYTCYIARRQNLPYTTEAIAADDWRIACQQWLSRRDSHG